MSIFFDFDVGPSGRRFRRAVNDDVPDIELFMDRCHTERLFGEMDIGYLIELSTLSICMINEFKEVVGFISLNDYPNVSGVNPDDWEYWIRNMYQMFYLSRNTLFIHFMCCKDSVLEYFLEEACISVFRNDVYLLNIVMFSCDPEHVTRYQIFKKKTMSRYTARRPDDSESKPHFLYVAKRQDYCPKLKIRRAVEEDNDDIVKILDKKCPKLKELYGSYYISEMIGHHLDSNRNIIVPEYLDHAVGVMCLNSEINYKKLQSMYELRPYYGLMKATALEKEQLKRSNVLLSSFGDPIMMGKLNPFDRPSQVRDDYSDSYMHDETSPRASIHVKKQSKVNFKRRASVKPQLSLSVFVHPSDDYSGHIHSPRLSLISYASIEQLILDEDPFDYEIVNIDKSLLSLSEALSCELLLDNNKSGQSSVMSLEGYPMDLLQPQISKRRRTQSFGSGMANERKTWETEKLLNGEPNAFMIELFALRDDVHESNSIDLLEVAFEIMKDYDYCVIHVPSADRTFPLLEHFTFVPVKQGSCSEYSLYIAHRASVFGKLRVREAEIMDIPLIARFLQNVAGSETIYTIETSILERMSYQVYVFMSGLSLIGVGILEPPEQLNLIRAKCNIDPYHHHKYHLPGQGIKTGFAAVKVILTYPVFEVHYRFFAREMMRLSGSNSLIWLTAYRSKMVMHKANSIASAMVPLLPRKTQIDFTRIPELKIIAPIANNVLPFSTWFLDKKLTSVPMFNINTRIVLVGASRTCMAFLNALLFSYASTYLRFNNITLISTHGFAYMRHSSASVELMFPKHHTTSEKFLKSVPYTYYVNTIHGTVGEINKQEKYVALTHGSNYFYDLLFLFVGKQYQHPEYLKPLLEQNNKCTADAPYVRMDVPNKYVEPDYVNYNTPDNVFIINHIVEANNALKYVRNLLTEGFDFKLIVYGATIHAYCCLTALLEMKVPATSIIFVDPFPSENPRKARVSVFSNFNVDETVRKVIKDKQMKVYRSYYFQSWSVVDKMVTHVEFLSQFQMIKLECSAFFYYGKRGVNTQMFLAVNKSGMAYDGGVLIDHQYRTKVPSIYAAGPATAYYRKYYGATKKQKYYDTYEVGEKLGIQIRNQLDPVFTDSSQRRRSSVRFSVEQTIEPDCGSSIDTNEDSSSNISPADKDYDKPKDNKWLPDFQKPKVVYCKLPGGLQYLEVRSPGKKVPHHYVHSLHFRGTVMETFKNGYFKLHLSNEYIVDGITCLTNEKYNLEKFRYLYGKSSAILNNVHVRYATKKLNDFYEFFRSPWAYFLYHDQTDELFAMVKELLPKYHEGQRGETLADALRSHKATEMDLDDTLDDMAKLLQMRKKFHVSPYIQAVTDYVIEWVSQNHVLLPMYLQPSGIADFQHDMERLPMFRKKKMKISKMIQKVL